MPEVTIKIGDRPFKVACPAGEESQLQGGTAGAAACGTTAQWRGAEAGVEGGERTGR